MQPDTTRFATRLNSFASKPEAYWPKGPGKPTPLQMAERASKAAGLTDVELNDPDQLGSDPRAVGNAIRDLGLAVNGLAMRYSNPACKIGAFTNPDPAVRREAIDLTKRAIDAGRKAGCQLMTLWLGQDGFDYAFPSIPVVVQSTHGAGDTFVGTLASRLAAGDGPQQALECANRSAARLVATAERER